MLVLSRQKNETIEATMTVDQMRQLLASLPPDTPPDAVALTAKIAVVEIRGTKVRLGLDAPPQVQFLRGELVGTPAASDLHSPAVTHD